MDKDNSESEKAPIYEKIPPKKGNILTSSSIVFLILAFFGALLVTGYLVYYFSSGEKYGSDEVISSSYDNNNQSLRLPPSLRPIHYNIEIQPFLNGNFSTFGHVDIYFEVVRETSVIVLHLLDIITRNETIKLVSSNDHNQEIKFVNHTYDPKTHFYTGILESALEMGSTYVISMDYIGYLNNNMYGFYRSTYTHNNETIIIAATQFEATHARRAFPCFDEPALKATFTIKIGRPEGYHVISNMPSLNTVPIEGQPGWYWDIFNATLPMSTYLIAFIVSDFVANKSENSENILFKIWARKEAISQTEYAANLGPKILQFYEEYFGIPFPLPKQDMAALPDHHSGAMENWGLVTYRESMLLYDSQNSKALDKQNIGKVIAHELAHQWFGDLVSPKWWSELWLNEGFASYMEYIGLHAVEPSFKILEQIAVQEIHFAFKMDALDSSHPINVEVENTEEILQIFDSISYSKGAAIIRMMSHFLTESTFKKGVTNYLNALSYSSATQDDLWQYLTVEAHKDGTLDVTVTVKEIMDTWTLQKGFPVITLIRDHTQYAMITQEKFTLSATGTEGQKPNESWWVPLTLVTQGDPNFTLTEVSKWMSVEETQIYMKGLPSADEWVILNTQQSGYYRVNYDEANWLSIITQLQTDHTVIAVLNRAQIIEDSLNLARAGMLDYKIPLQVGQYLSQEKDLVPWLTALNNFHYLITMFERHSGYGYLKKYLISVESTQYISLGFEDSLEDPHDVQLLRSSILSSLCRLGYEDCINSAKMLYNQWMESSDESITMISANVRRTVYCYGISEGGTKEWNFAWKKYMESNLGCEKDNLLYALGCTKKIWILQRYLEMSFVEGGYIRKQDVYKVIQSVSENVAGREVAWRYLKQNWNEIGVYMGINSTRGEFTYIIASSFNTQEEFQMLLDLKYDRYESVGIETTQSFNQAVEIAQYNVAWMEQSCEAVCTWLIINGYGDDEAIAM